MKNNRQISFLMGSGFSRPIKIPGVKEINSALLSIKKENIIVSSDLMASFKSNNSSNEFEQLEDCHRYFLEEFIVWYKNEWLKKKNAEFDYEQFFDDMQEFEIGNRHPNFTILLKAFIDRNQYFRKGYEPFPSIQIILYWLIAGMLSNFASNDLETIYGIFINLLQHLHKNGYSICVHTLNHDLLIEELFRLSMLPYDDGFSFNENWYFNEMETGIKKRIMSFDNTYAKQIKVYKIHGSIDYYSATIDARNMTFKERKFPRLSPIIYGNNGTVPENANSFDPMPVFFTGKTLKIKQYPRFEYTTIQLKNFERNLDQSERLIIIGYGFQDKGINTILPKAANKTIICDMRLPTMIPFAESEYIFVNKSASTFGLQDVSFSQNLT